MGGVLALVALVAAAVSIAPGAAVPLIAAAVLAYGLDPIADKLEARGLSRAAAAGITLAGALGALAGLALLVAPGVLAELGQLPAQLARAIDAVVPQAEKLLKTRFPHNLTELTRTLSGKLASTDALPLAAEVASRVAGTAAGVLGAVAGLLVVPFVAYFWLRDFDRGVAAAAGLLPSNARAQIVERTRELDRVFSGLIRGQLTVAFILAALYSAGLALCGLDQAVGLGIIAGLGYLVPFLGPAIAFLLALLLAALEMSGPLDLVLVLVCFVVLQGAEGALLTPRIVGARVGLSPVSVVVAALVFGNVFGLPGVIAAVPLAAVLKVLGRVGGEHWKRRMA